jgi:hypothetical protein
MKVPTNTTPRTQRASGDKPFIQNRAGAGASSQAALGNQLVQLGNTMGSVGGLIDQQATQARRFGVMQNFSAFSTAVDEKLMELKRNADPAQGNFADTAVAEYSNWEADWLATVPDEFHDEFATRAADIKASVARDSLAFQYERTDEFFRQGVTDQLNAALISLDQDGSPANLAAQRANLDEFIASTTLTEAEQTAIRRNVYKGLESVSYKAEVRRGNIEVGALGVGSAPGAAADLILEFDGASLENGLDYETNRGLVDERVKEAEQIAVAAVGDLDRWAAMPSRVRGALISLVDDLGELPDTVQAAIASGDLAAVAQAVADLSGTEGDRRDTEADIILGLRDMPEGQLDTDPNYANIPYEDRLALRADAEREAAAQQTAEQAASLAAQKAAINQLELGLMDGNAGQYDIDQAREQGWLTQAADVKRLQAIIDAQNETLIGTQQIQAMITSGMTGNPADEDFRKAFNTFVGPEGEAALRQRDPQYVANVLVPAVRTLGDLPTDTVGLLTGMMRGQDPNQALFALDTLAQLEQASPEAYNARVTEEVAADVAYWQSAKDYYPADEVLASVRGGTTQEERTRVTMLREEARKLINDGSVSTTTGVEKYIMTLRSTMGDAGGWRNGDPIMAAGTEQAMTADYIQLFEREYARDGNEQKAQERATQALGRVWQVTTAGGEQQLMKYPPEKVGYQTWNGNYDWITEQGRADLGLEDNTPFQLISDEQTRSEYQEWAAGKSGAPRPSYLAVYKDANGNLKMPMETVPGAGGERFPTGKPMRLFFEVTPEMEAVKAEQFSQENEALARKTAIDTYNAAKRHSLHTGTPIPQEIEDAYNEAVAEGGVPRNTSLVFQNWGQ